METEKLHKYLGGESVKEADVEAPFAFNNPPAGDKITNLLFEDW